MVGINSLPVETLLVVFSNLPHYNEKGVLDHGVYLTCRYLSQVWKMEFWKSLSVTNMNAKYSKLCSCTRHGNGHVHLARTRRISLKRFLTPGRLSHNFQHVRELYICLSQHNKFQHFTAGNIKSLYDSFAGLVHIDVCLSRPAGSKYGNYVPRVLEQNFPGAFMELKIVHDPYPSSLAGYWTHPEPDPSPGPLVGNLSEVTVDNMRLEVVTPSPNPLDDTNSIINDTPGDVRNWLVVSPRPNAGYGMGARLVERFGALRHLTLYCVNVSPFKTADTVECLEIIGSNGGGSEPVKIKTLASTITLCQRSRDAYSSVEVLRWKGSAFTLEAPKVTDLTIDLNIYFHQFLDQNTYREGYLVGWADRVYVPHVLPEFPSYRLHLTEVFFQGAAGTSQFNPRALFEIEIETICSTVVAGANSLHHDVPYGEQLFLQDDESSPQVVDPYGHARMRKMWRAYFFEMFLVKANHAGTLRNLTLFYPFSGRNFQALINNTELGPLIGEMATQAHQGQIDSLLGKNKQGIDSLHVHLKFNSKRQVNYVFNESPLSQILQCEDRFMLDGEVQYVASINLEAYYALYRTALSRGNVVKRRFGYPAKLEGADIVH